MLFAWGWMPLVRLNGLSGDLIPEYHWRWTPTPEQMFLSEHSDPDADTSSAFGTSTVRLQPGDWPGFRGPKRDGIVHGVAIRTDWHTAPPAEIWRNRVGPAWSSIIVVDGRLFTQEQRGQMEAVVCYDAATGKELWSHEDKARFDEETAGPGPRATPCFLDGRIYSLGCTGIVNCLDAATGESVWQRAVAEDCGAAEPHWGFTSSPIAFGDLVVVFGGGQAGKDLVAYRAKSGDIVWTAAVGETSYGSPQLAKVCGQEQILMLSNRCVCGVEPDTGKVLWEHLVTVPPSAPRSIVPLVPDASQVLFASEGDIGLALLEVKRDGKSWTANQRWQSRGLKPAFNDPVVWKGSVYGFDGRIFACVDLETGQKRWKSGRYGEGQELLIADQDLLLIISETGELILVRANPERQEELVRFQVLDGKTWNHPALVGGRLYVRNAKEMACYDVDPKEPK
jgi:outer membrane protein assembly factor BamB